MQVSGYPTLTDLLPNVRTVHVSADGEINEPTAVTQLTRIRNTLDYWSLKWKTMLVVFRPWVVGSAGHVKILEEVLWWETEKWAVAMEG